MESSSETDEISRLASPGETRVSSKIGLGRGYLPELDGIRAVSIAAVLLSHLILSGQILPSLRAYNFPLGSVGVSIFFVISGYLITTLLLREEDKCGYVHFKKFYVRRALRLLPALYCYLFALGVLRITGLLADLPWHSVAACLLYVRNYVGHGYETAHIWSLSIEEQFYFIWPILLRSIPSKKRLGATAALIGIVCAWRTFLVLTTGISFGMLYIRTDVRIDTILFGCLLSLILRDPRLAKTARLLAGGGVLLLAAVALLLWNLAFLNKPRVFLTVDTTVTALLIALLLNGVLLHPNARLTCALRNKGMVYIGKLSYSLYLWQQLFLDDSPGLEGLRRFPQSLVASFLIAAASFHFVEKPILKLKDRYFQTV